MRSEDAVPGAASSASTVLSPPSHPSRPIAAQDFERLCAAFAPSGGLVPSNALAGAVQGATQGAHGQGVGVVARWIVEARVIAIPWRGDYWMPRFQFCTEGHAIHPALPTVLAELPFAGDAMDSAEWFARENAALHGARPCELLACRPAQVCEAARLLRFALAG